MLNLIKKISSHEGARRYAKNSGWLLLEHFFKAVVAILVGFYVGRYLGPDRFGLFSYLTSIVALVAAFARLGLDGVVVRELLESGVTKESESRLLGTSFWMQVISTVVFSGIALSILGFGKGGQADLIYVFILCFGVFFQAFGFIDWYFQSKVQSKIVVKCRVFTALFSSIAKIVAVQGEAPLIAFFIISALEGALLAALYFLVTVRSGLSRAYFAFSWSQCKYSLSSSWPLLASAVAVTVYTKIDQIMIKELLGDYEVGIYSAAVKFYEAWVVVPYLLSLSFLPAIKKAREKGTEIYERRLIQFFGGLFWASAIVSLLLGLFSENIILFSYGPGFLPSAKILGVVMFSAAWVALGNCSARYCIAERLEKYILTRSLFAAVLNVGLNFYLIPRFGVSGAAYATLLSMFIANYVMDWFSKDLKQLLRIKHRAIFYKLVA